MEGSAVVGHAYTVSQAGHDKVSSFYRLVSINEYMSGSAVSKSESQSIPNLVTVGSLSMTVQNSVRYGKNDPHLQQCANSQ